MSLEDAIDKREKAIISELQEKQVAINDRTGKGLSTENVIEKALIRPFLPPKFDCTKGAVITSKKPEQQSAAIDRWGSLQKGWTVDLSNYIKGTSEILAE